MKSFGTIAAALSLGSTAYAQISTQRLSSDVSVALSIPDSTANSGNGDIFFQIVAPTSYEWFALGQGSSMTGSNIFVVYTDSTGNNVTVSPRLGTGHVMPQHDTAARISVLEGSGVQNGQMTANVRCSNCDSWSGGSMDFSGSSGSWIYAYKSGSAMNTDELDATISEHDGHNGLEWQFADAVGGDGSNPFVAAGGSTGTQTAVATSAAPTTVSGTVIPGSCTPIAASNTAASATAGTTATATSDDDGDGCPTGIPRSRPPASCLTRSGYPGRPTGPPKVKRDDGCPAGYEAIQNNGVAPGSPDLLSSSSGPSDTILMAHGVIACIAFVALFPIGGILIRVASFPGLLWIHAALQGFAFLFYIIAFGMGVYLATTLDLMNNPHPIIGIVLLIILLLQPIGGFLHHRLFKKYNHRTLWSYVHIWHGRIAILLGIVNGGLGIRLAGDASNGQVIAYGVIGGLVGVVYIACAIFGEMRRSKNQPPNYEKSERAQERDQRRQSHQLRDLSGSDDDQNAGYYGRKEGQRV